MRRIIARILIAIVLITSCTPKIERELHACFDRCAKAHEKGSLPRAQCNDLCSEAAKPTPTTPANQDLAKIKED